MFYMLTSRRVQDMERASVPLLVQSSAIHFTVEAAVEFIFFLFSYEAQHFHQVTYKIPLGISCYLESIVPSHI